MGLNEEYYLFEMELKLFAQLIPFATEYQYDVEYYRNNIDQSFQMQNPSEEMLELKKELDR